VSKFKNQILYFSLGYGLAILGRFYGSIFGIYTEAGITNVCSVGNIADSAGLSLYDPGKAVTLVIPSSTEVAALIHTVGGAALRQGHMGRDHHMAREERRRSDAFVSDTCAPSCPSSPAAR
jgi:hypothetical protein